MSKEVVRERDTGWQRLLELRCQHEIVERWLRTAGVPELLQEQLQQMLQSIELELHGLETAKRPEAAQRMREAS
jgi:hypothetical protein